jgi:hypothetical protein
VLYKLRAEDLARLAKKESGYVLREFEVGCSGGGVVPSGFLGFVSLVASHHWWHPNPPARRPINQPTNQASNQPTP